MYTLQSILGLISNKYCEVINNKTPRAEEIGLQSHAITIAIDGYSRAYVNVS